MHASVHGHARTACITTSRTHACKRKHTHRDACGSDDCLSLCGSVRLSVGLSYVFASSSHVWLKAMKRGMFLRGLGGKKQRLACISDPSGSLLTGPSASHASVGGTGPLYRDPEVDVLLELWSLGHMSALK